MASPDVFDSQDPATALEKAVELNRIKTGEGFHPTVQIESASRTTSKSTFEEADLTGGDHFPADPLCREKNLISLADCKGELANYLPERQKWFTLFIVWLVQISMNLNTSLYSDAIPGISKQFYVCEDLARWGAASFLMAYAFGCELWAPWSEELGRYWVLQTSLGLVNVLQFGIVFAENINMVLAFRALGGLSTAGGSIALGILADMWDKEHHQAPVAFVVYASVGGSVLGPIVGGLIEQYTSWKWAIWVQLIFGGVVQFLHFLFVPETRATILMDRVAKRRRAAAEKRGGYLNLWGPNEIAPFRERFSWTEIFATWLRPFKMFFTEPIVLWLSLLSGFSDALVFMFIQSFGLVYKQWGFTPITIGLAFLPFLVGYTIAWISWIPVIRRNKKERARKPSCERAHFESRLWWLLYLAPCLPIGLFGFAWTSSGPPVHWIGSMVFTCLCGIANYAIYMATVDYMVTAYGPYSASATGGNGWARDFLAGVLTPAALPFFTIRAFGDHAIEYSGTILATISTVLVACVFVIYRYGPQLRKKSRFAQKLKAADEDPEQRDRIGITCIPETGSGTTPCSSKFSSDATTQFEVPLQPTASRSEQILHSRVGFSRQASPNASCHPSRANSYTRGKRPTPAARSKSLFRDKREAAKIHVDPSLLYPAQPGLAPSQNHDATDTLPATRYEQRPGGNAVRATEQTSTPTSRSIANPSVIVPAKGSNVTVPTPATSSGDANGTSNHTDRTEGNVSNAATTSYPLSTSDDLETQSGATSTGYVGSALAVAPGPIVLSPSEAPAMLSLHMPQDPPTDP